MESLVCDLTKALNSNSDLVSVAALSSAVGTRRQAASHGHASHDIKRIDKSNRYGRHRLDSKLSQQESARQQQQQPSERKASSAKAKTQSKREHSSKSRRRQQQQQQHQSHHGHRKHHHHHHRSHRHHHHHHGHRIKRHNSYNRFKSSMLNREKKQKHITQVLMAAAAAAAASIGPPDGLADGRMETANVDVHSLVRFNTNTFRSRGILPASLSDAAAINQCSRANNLKASRRSRQLLTSCRVQKSYKTTSRFSNSIRRRRQLQINRLQRLTSIFNMRRARKKASSPRYGESRGGVKLVKSSADSHSAFYGGSFLNGNHHHLVSRGAIDSASKLAYSVSTRSRLSESSSNFSSSSPCSSSDSSLDDDDNDCPSSSTDYTSSTINTSCSSMSSMSSLSSSSSSNNEESSDSSLMSDTDMVASSLADCLKTAHLNSGKEELDEDNDAKMTSVQTSRQPSAKANGLFFKKTSHKSADVQKAETMKLKKFKKRKLKTRPVSNLMTSAAAAAAAVSSKTASTSTNSFKLDVPGKATLGGSASARSRQSRRSMFTSNNEFESVSSKTKQLLPVVNTLLNDSSLTRIKATGQTAAAAVAVASAMLSPTVISSSSTSSILIPSVIKTASKDYMHAESIAECGGAKSSSVIGSSIHSFDSMFNYKGSITELNDELNSSSLNSSMNAACEMSGRENATCDDCYGGGGGVYNYCRNPSALDVSVESNEGGAGGYKRKRDDHHLLKDVQMKATRRARLLRKSNENAAAATDDMGINYNPDELISNGMFDAACSSKMADQEAFQTSDSKTCKSFYILNKTTGVSRLTSLAPGSGSFSGLKYDNNQSSDDTEYENNPDNEADEEDENEEDDEHDKGLFFKFDSHHCAAAAAGGHSKTGQASVAGCSQLDGRCQFIKRPEIRINMKSYDEDLEEEEDEDLEDRGGARGRDVLADEADDEQSDWPSNEKSSKPVMMLSSEAGQPL